MIPTGLAGVDGALPGGLQSGVIDICGPPASGKTQLALQIAGSCVASGGTVLVEDTTGKFRPERLLGMLEAAGSDPGLLEAVSVCRPTSVEEQWGVQRAAGVSGYSLVVIDEVSSLFTFEYHRDGQIAGRDLLFARYMMDLSRASLDGGLPYLIVDSVTGSKFQKGHMPQIIGMFSHARVRLSADDAGSGRLGSVESPWARSEFRYGIGPLGLEEY